MFIKFLVEDVGRGRLSSSVKTVRPAESRPPVVEEWPLDGVLIREAVDRAAAEYARNERRTNLLGRELFANPAWNMLLDLFISWSAERRLSVSDVCIGSRSPMATALRYLSLLVDGGLAVRSADSSDRRRTIVSLTEKGLEWMLDCLLQDALRIVPTVPTGHSIAKADRVRS